MHSNVKYMSVVFLMHFYTTYMNSTPMRSTCRILVLHAIPVQYMYNIYLYNMYNTHTIHVQYVYNTCTMPVHYSYLHTCIYVYSTCKTHVQCMSNTCTITVQYMYNTCKVHVQYWYTTCTYMYVRRKFTTYNVHTCTKQPAVTCTI